MKLALQPDELDKKWKRALQCTSLNTELAHYGYKCSFTELAQPPPRRCAQRGRGISRGCRALGSLPLDRCLLAGPRYPKPSSQPAGKGSSKWTGANR